MKLYPVIYVPAFLFALKDELAISSKDGFQRRGTRAQLLNVVQLHFLVALCGLYAALGAVCYLWCGYRYIDQAIVHHLVRADARHNFSPYFLSFYLSAQESALRCALSIICFVPQVSCFLFFHVRQTRNDDTHDVRGRNCS